MPDTQHLYTLDEVCAVPTAGETVLDYTNETEALKQGAKVAHCGKCAACSTRTDIDIYKATANSMTSTATACAMRAIFGAVRLLHPFLHVLHAMLHHFRSHTVVKRHRPPPSAALLCVLHWSTYSHCVRQKKGGRGSVESCFDERVGFTPACRDCWVDNV